MYDAKTYNHNRYRLHRLQAIEYLGGLCRDCGYKDDLRAFEFDHVARERQLNERSVAECFNSPWPKIQAMLDECELVCASCHAIRTAQRREERRLQSW